MRADVDQAYKRMRDASQTLSDEEILAAKLNLLNDLILQDILLAKARTLKLEVARAIWIPPMPTRGRTWPTKPFSRS